MCLKICKKIRSIFKVFSKLPFKFFKENFECLDKMVKLFEEKRREEDEISKIYKNLEKELEEELNQIFKKDKNETII